MKPAAPTVTVPLLVFLMAFCAGLPASAGAAGIDYGQPRQLGIITDENINESSGLACSPANPETFWTHNDSGDQPRLFLIARDGQTRATLIVKDAEARDWEDMASFKDRRHGYLLVGDVGDNDAKREQYTLYIIREPRIMPNARAREIEVRPSITLPFKYEDGSHNCESVAIDPTTGRIYLVSKEGGSECKVYELPTPKRTVTTPVTAKVIAILKIPTATAMDISPDGLRAVVLAGGGAYEYTRNMGETWAKAFGGEPRIIHMPERAQGESICYGADGKTLHLTSEKVAQPFWEVPVARDE